MARFGKAQPKQARLKVAIYGPPGSGKTFTTLLMAEGLAKLRGKSVNVVDTERGTDFYAKRVPERRVHPEAFEFNALYSRSLAEVLDALNALDPAKDGVIIIDSISHIWDAAIGAYHGKMTGIGGIPMHAWGPIKKPYKKLMDLLINGPFDVFILGRQKNLFDTNAEGDMEKTGVGMRAEGETPHEPHICLRMESQRVPNDPTQMKSKCVAFVEKDRTGILQGREIAFPSFATIEPLLPLLGEEQAPSENEEERLAMDGELLDSMQNGKAKKAGQSAELFAELQAKLAAATDLLSLASAAHEIEKAKRKLLEEHTGALRELYKVKRDKLAPEIQ